MTHLEFFKKLKRLTATKPSICIIGFFFVSAFFILCFFHLDYRAVTKGFRRHSSLMTWHDLNGSLDDNQVRGFLEDDGDGRGMIVILCIAPKIASF